jgi:hypothetical protein
LGFVVSGATINMNFYSLHQLPPELMEVANAECKLFGTNQAEVIGKNIYLDSAQRDSTLRVPTAHNYWLGGLLHYYGLLANKTWNFNINNHEPIQIADYNKDQHFNWHVDLIPFSGELDRKLTVICMISDRADFTGGELMVRNPREYNDVHTIPLQQGTIVTFPSFLEHVVTPVESGLRRTATMWLSGPCFR